MTYFLLVSLILPGVFLMPSHGTVHGEVVGIERKASGIKSFQKATYSARSLVPIVMFGLSAMYR
jgi:hypothetical protein